MILLENEAASYELGHMLTSFGRRPSYKASLHFVGSCKLPIQSRETHLDAAKEESYYLVDNPTCRRREFLSGMSATRRGGSFGA